MDPFHERSSLRSVYSMSGSKLRYFRPPIDWTHSNQDRSWTGHFVEMTAHGMDQLVLKTTYGLDPLYRGPLIEWIHTNLKHNKVKLAI